MSPSTESRELTIREFQRAIEAIYYARDSQRGIDRSFMWFIEEVGELAEELRRTERDPARLTEEIADVLAWLTTLAAMLGIEMTDCAAIYADGCPKCRRTPCEC